MRLVERDDLFDGYLGRAIAIGHVAENHEAAAIGAPAHALLDQRGARASAEHEHAPLDRLGIDHAREADAERRDENEAEQDRDAEHAAPDAELRHDVVEDDEADRAAGERGEKPRQDAEPRIAQVHLVEAERDHAEHDERAERAGAEHQMPGEHALRIRIGEIPEMRRKPERERQQSELARSEHEQPAPRVVAQKTQHVASYAPCECVPWRQGKRRRLARWEIVLRHVLPVAKSSMNRTPKGPPPPVAPTRSQRRTFRSCRFRNFCQLSV